MTQGALEIARSFLSVPRRTLHKVGDFEFCDLDYRQVCLWAEQFSMTPDDVVKMLVEMAFDEKLPPWFKEDKDRYRFSGFTVEDGHIKSLSWCFYETPRYAFQLLDGMHLEKLFLYGHNRSCLFNGGEVDLHLPVLEVLFCVDCEIITLDLSGMPLLEIVDCSGNKLVDLDLTHAYKLKKLSCCYNRISCLSLSPLPNLTYLNCGDNMLTRLDLTPAPNLVGLYCQGNQLTELDLEPVRKLHWLYCWGNQLVALNLIYVPNLRLLYCFMNQLAELGLSAVPQLTDLWCPANQLTELDIRPLKNLKELKVDDNVRIMGNRP